MKKIIGAMVIFLFLMSGICTAQQQGIHEPGTGLDDTGGASDTGNDSSGQQGVHEPGTGLVDNQTTPGGAGQGQQVSVEEKTQNKNDSNQIQAEVRTREEINKINENSQQKRLEFEQELQNAGEKQKIVLKNQNEVRLAVHSLLEMENLTGGIGPQVSQIARQFNNSVQATIKAEEKIQTRSSVRKFLFGGDQEAAEELDAETARIQDRLRELEQLRQDCECDEQVKAMLQEQIQSIEQEQIRLQQVAQDEKKSKGLLGWLWK